MSVKVNLIAIDTLNIYSPRPDATHAHFLKNEQLHGNIEDGFKFSEPQYKIYSNILKIYFYVPESNIHKYFRIIKPLNKSITIL